MAWTADYEPGQPVRVRYQGGWRKAQVVTVRSRSLMALLLRGTGQQTTNIHDPRNIEPCPSKKPRSMSPEPPSFDFTSTG
jgi:hypothetical protein